MAQASAILCFHPSHTDFLSALHLLLIPYFNQHFDHFVNPKYFLQDVQNPLVLKNLSL